MRLTRADLDSILAPRNYPTDWDCVITSTGGGIGKIDWADANAVTFRWWARTSGQHNYRHVADDDLGKTEKKPDVWIEQLEVSVCTKKSTPQVDARIVSGH